MIKILGKEVLFSTKYLNFIQTKFLDKNKNQHQWFSAERPNHGKTVIIAALMDNKLVVTKEFRIPIGDYEWALPAGLVDGEELPEETAKRELKEETNLELISISEQTPYLYNSAGMSNEVVSIVFGQAAGQIGQQGNEHAEDISSYLLDQKQILELLENKDFKFSAKAYLIFRRFASGNLW